MAAPAAQEIPTRELRLQIQKDLAYMWVQQNLHRDEFVEFRYDPFMRDVEDDSRCAEVRASRAEQFKKLNLLGVILKTRPAKGDL